VKSCQPALLVGLDFLLPADPGIAYEGIPPNIGCNRLMCGDCNVAVRHADGCSITGNYAPTQVALEKLYESSDPRSSSLLDASPLHARSRAYFCRCAWAAANHGGTKVVDVLDQTWYCDGHE
jgi:hypothetical protein